MPEEKKNLTRDGQKVSSKEVKDFYDEFTDRFARDYIEGNKRVDAQLDFLINVLSTSAKRILVVGCGTGLVPAVISSQLVPGADVMAVDISHKNIELAKLLFAKQHVTYRHLDVLSQELSESWDVIILPDVYEHIARTSRPTLHARLKELLSKDGSIMMTFPSVEHQNKLQQTGEGLQVIDELVTLEDVEILAKETGCSLTYYNTVSVWNQGDYVHAVIDRKQTFRQVGKKGFSWLTNFKYKRMMARSKILRFVSNKFGRKWRKRKWQKAIKQLLG